MKDVTQHGWKEVSLEEICEKTETVDPRKSPEDLFDYVDVSSVSNETFTIGETQKLLGADAPSRARRQIRSGDILFATIRPTLQRIAQVPEHLNGQVCSTGYIVLRPKPDLDARFLMHALFRPDFMDAMEKLQSGASYPAVTDKQVRSQKIPLPPLEEQQRIVAILDEAFEGLARARTHAEANLQNARELFNAELEKVFDVELADEDRATFEDITKDTLIGLVRSKKEQGPEREYDYAKMNNIGNDDRFVGPVLDRVDCTPEEASRFELRGGDFLFNTRNSRELVGKSCVVEADFQRPTVFNNNVMRVRFVSKVNSRFVALAFKSKLAKAQLEVMKSGTTNVVAIYHKSLKKLTLPMPCLETQRTLVDRFEELDAAIQRLISSYSEQAEDADDLRQSLLQKAFAGELT